jgi:hypothetical protein
MGLNGFSRQSDSIPLSNYFFVTLALSSGSERLDQAPATGQTISSLTQAAGYRPQLPTCRC